MEKAKSMNNTLKSAIIKEYKTQIQPVQTQNLGLQTKKRSNLRNYFYAQRKYQRPMTVTTKQQKRQSYQEYWDKIKNQPESPNIGMMKPFFINLKPGLKNTGYAKAVEQPQKINITETVNKITFKNSTNLKKSEIYDQLIRSQHDSFELNTKSQYKKKERKLYNSNRKKQEILQEQYIFNNAPDKQLNIIGLQTSQFWSERKSTDRKNIYPKSNTKRQSQKLLTEEILQNNENSQILKYHSNFLASNRKVSHSTHQVYDKSRLSLTLASQKHKKKVNHPNIFVSYLGTAKPSMNSDELQLLRIMYYKDFIWKIWFNYSLRFEGSTSSPRYYVGKGNNSRLIKSIMGKRWWWKTQTRQENANFLWTQLKLYSVYQQQNSLTSLDKFQSYQSSDGWNIQKISEHHDKNSNLLTKQKYQIWKKYLNANKNLQKKNSQGLQSRQKLQKEMAIMDSPKKVSNHLEYSRLIGNKKALYKTMTIYQQLLSKPNKWLPMTYHITCGLQDDQYLKFLNEYYYRLKKLNNTSWIVKPGQMSNRGNGIIVCKDLNDIKAIIKKKKTHLNGTPFTYIIQQYLDKPFLYNGRKFDLRHYIMITSVNGRIQGYFYQEGYIRTTSYKYSTKSQKASVHLTNDAVQKYCKDYGKYEQGNKVSYEQFEQYLQKTYNGKYSFYKDIYPKIRQICIQLIQSCYYLIDPKRRQNNFQIFGLDIMIDENFKLWLIEANTNPCLQISSKILAKLIPKMIDNAFMIALDPLYPPPADLFTKRINLPQNSINQNKFQLVFDEIVDGYALNSKYEKADKQINEMKGFASDDEAYESGEDDCDFDF